MNRLVEKVVGIGTFTLPRKGQKCQALCEFFCIVDGIVIVMVVFALFNGFKVRTKVSVPSGTSTTIILNLCKYLDLSGS